MAVCSCFSSSSVGRAPPGAANSKTGEFLRCVEHAAWVPPVAGTFQKEVMNALADLGEKMGADPASWRTEPPN